MVNSGDLKLPTTHALKHFAKDDRCPGAKYVYHLGLIGADRHDDKDVDAIAKMAFELAEAGVIALVQRKLGDGVYLYAAERR